VVTWILNNWLAVVVVGAGCVSLVCTFIILATGWAAGRADDLLGKTKIKK
jgi:hypothetical protein